MTDPCRLDEQSAAPGNEHRVSRPPEYAHCVTCSDEAIAARVSRLLPSGLALVDTGHGGDAEEISVALVDAAVGDTVLVHAKEALAVLSRKDAPPPVALSASASASRPVCAIPGALDEADSLGGAFQAGPAAEAG